jgi:hypothetical protein
MGRLPDGRVIIAMPAGDERRFQEEISKGQADASLNFYILAALCEFHTLPSNIPMEIQKDG